MPNKYKYFFSKEYLIDVKNGKYENDNDFIIDLFNFQYTNNPIYNKFCNLVARTPQNISNINDIPFLPVQFFKTQDIKTLQWNEEAIFTSSATTGQTPSKHFCYNIDYYHFVCESIFEEFYGNVASYQYIALLPSYLERSGSSLIEMVSHFIKKSPFPESSFYLNEYDKINQIINSSENQLVIFGVSFALLDFIEKNDSFNNDNLIIIETGGMKGRREEIVREELHKVLKKGFNIGQISSEYGMTELMSQAYSKQNGVFHENNFLKIIIKDINDPFQVMNNNRIGIVNIIDFANIYTCCFVATEDIGKKLDNSTFEILGRHDNSEVRGCNLMFNL